MDPGSRKERLRLLPSHVYLLKAAAVRARSLRWLARQRGTTPPDGARILFYHRVSDDADPLAVSPARFRRQMDHLHEQGYEVVDVVELARRLGDGEPTSRVIGLSFDDGYRDVAEHALPILAERGFGATVFVVTGVLDGTADFEWYETTPATLSWDEVVSLDGSSPLRFEAHTHSHRNLLSLDDATAAREIGECKARLEARLGREVEAFCYPAGVFGPRERRLAEEAGYRLAVTCEPGVNDATTDPFALHRTQIESHDRLVDFRARIGGGHDADLPFRQALRRARYGVD